MLMLLKAMCHLFSLECGQAVCSCPLCCLPAVKLLETMDVGSFGGLLEVKPLYHGNTDSNGPLIDMFGQLHAADRLDKVTVSTLRTLSITRTGGNWRMFVFIRVFSCANLWRYWTVKFNIKVMAFLHTIPKSKVHSLGDHLGNTPMHLFSVIY